MGSTIFTILALIIGAAIVVAGLYYRQKEKDDRDSQKIFTTFTFVGALVVAGTIIKILCTGL